MEEKEWWQRMKQTEPFPHAEMLLRFQPVVFREDRGEWDLWNDVAVEFILEQGRCRQVESEHQVAHRFYNDFCGFFEPETVSGVGFGRDLLRFDFEFALEDAVDNAGARFCFAAAESEMGVVEEPAQEVDRVRLVEEIKLFVGLAGDLLDEFVWGDVCFEGTGIPHLTDEDGEALDEFGFAGEIFEHEEVA